MWILIDLVNKHIDVSIPSKQKIIQLVNQAIGDMHSLGEKKREENEYLLSMSLRNMHGADYNTGNQFIIKKTKIEK